MNQSLIRLISLKANAVNCHNQKFTLKISMQVLTFLFNQLIGLYTVKPSESRPCYMLHVTRTSSTRFSNFSLEVSVLVWNFK